MNSGPRPCLIDVGFPLSGPQDRTSTSDLNNMPGTPASPSGLGSARGRATPLPGNDVLAATQHSERETIRWRP